jgi:CheY-like chemotaxis protein
MTSKNIFRILLISDNGPTLSLYREVLGQKGYMSEKSAMGNDLIDEYVRHRKPDSDFELTCCLQAEGALGKLRSSIVEKSPFCMVFLDMPNSEQQEVLFAAENIREIDPDINIVIAAGPSDTKLFQLNKLVAPTGRLKCIEKPIISGKVMQLVSSLTKKWRKSNQTTNRRMFQEVRLCIK